MLNRVPLSPQQLEKLQDQIKPLPIAFDLISDHVIITDPNGNIIYANKGVEQETGYPITEIIGKNPGDLWGGHMSPNFYKYLWHQIKELKQPFHGEVQNIKKNGIPIWQEIRIYPVLDASGNIEIFIGIEPDITTRKLNETAERQKYEEIDRLLNTMSSKELNMITLKREVEELRVKLEKIK